MKLATEVRDVTKSKEFETTNYGVDASNLPLLFQLLRTNLYSDLHGSIIREYASNVIDSHTESGKPDTMGEIEWIPSSRMFGVDCQLIIRDFGVGLSPDRMKNIFGNYLSSTKRGDNEAIGGFGLGSKVAFAYTDSFSVQTVYNGWKYRYLCYIDDTQLGAISLLVDPVETTEGNGTEIIIPIKEENEDYTHFQEAISKQLAYFTSIRYKGFQMPDPVILFENADCMVKATPPVPELHVVLGNVAYQIDFKAIGFTDQYAMNNNGFNTCGIGLKFGIGELQPTMSRESLFWDPKTKEKVLEKITKAKKSIRHEIENELANEKDYAKWYASASLSRTASFPRQFNFADVKKQAEMITAGGKRLKMLAKATDWFSGHSIRMVEPFTGSRRRGSNVNPDYMTSPASDGDLEALPAYQLERNLSAATCLWLFRKHPKGFLAINHLAKPDEILLQPYYEATREWMLTLPSFDDIDVPAGAPSTNADEHARQYREMVKQRKLEGKFVAKIMRQDFNSHNTLENNFLYNQYENKFELMKDHTVIYGFQTDHAKMCKAVAMLTLSADFFNRWSSRSAGKPITVLKIGQHYEKQFFAMPNAHYIDDVLALEIPVFKEALASIATALRIKPKLHEYFALNFFGKINAEMQNRYKTVHKFVEDYSQRRPWNNDSLQNKILTLCAENLNEELEADWALIQEYFDGAGLMKNVNFAMYSSHHRDSNGGLGTTADYLRQWVRMNDVWIESYLISKGRHVDSDEEVLPKLAESEQVVLAVEPSTILEEKVEELVEVATVVDELIETI